MGTCIMENTINLNMTELSMILYYADFLSLRDRSIPVTDNCKYFYIYGVPINSAFILDMTPVFSINDKYFQQALNEFSIIKSKFNDDGLRSFVDDICSIRNCGMVDWRRMLTYIHQFSTKKEKLKSFNICETFLNNLRYKHTYMNDGEQQEGEQTKYVFHVEQAKKYNQQ